MKDMYYIQAENRINHRGNFYNRFQCSFNAAIIPKNGQIKTIQAHNESMYILAQKFYLYDVTQSVKGAIRKEVRENVISESGELIGNF